MRERTRVAYKFLSDEWIAAAKEIREQYSAPPVPHAVKMNFIVTDVPFGDGTVNAHMDTTQGTSEFDLGHLDGADVTATLDYETSRAMMVDQNPQAAMQAFMAGKIKLQGDMTKAMALSAAAPPDPEMTAKIKEITE
jgi:putative sterol carrier protein